MPNIAAAFKAEILRLSKKTVRQQVAPIRAITATQRRHIAALRKQVNGLERELTVLRRAAIAGPSIEPASSETPTRFVARGLASLRKRLDLSADDFGKLLGVSGVSVYNWEHKKAKPRPSIQAAIASLRSIGKREARARLELGPAKPPGRQKARRR